MGTLILYLTIGITFLILLFFFSFFAPLFRGAPFQPNSEEYVERIVRISGVKKGDKIADLGSGDGRIVIAFAKKGSEAHGFEINPILALISKWKIKKAGLQEKAFIHWGNFWKEDLGKYNIIISFQVFYAMGKLKEKLQKECAKKIKIVSRDWKFPGMNPKKTDGKIYLYEFSKK